MILRDWATVAAFTPASDPVSLFLSSFFQGYISIEAPYGSPSV